MLILRALSRGPRMSSRKGDQAASPVPGPFTLHFAVRRPPKRDRDTGRRGVRDGGRGRAQGVSQEAETIHCITLPNTRTELTFSCWWLGKYRRCHRRKGPRKGEKEAKTKTEKREKRKCAQETRVLSQPGTWLTDQLLTPPRPHPRSCLKEIGA